jgi:hypothetical protein
VNSLIAVARPVVEEAWDPPIVIPMDDSALLTTFMPLLGLLLVYGTALFSAFAGRMQ